MEQIQHKCGLKFLLREGTSDVNVIREAIDENAYGIQPDMALETVLDIGANIGAFSLFAAMMFPNARIISYEPEPSNRAMLESNIALNNLHNRITWWPYAVSNRRGRQSITQQCGNSRLLATFDGASNPAQATTVGCDTITLADVVRDNKIETCDFFKLDAEWSEFEILDAAEDVMRRFKRIAIEPHGTNVPKEKMDALFLRLSKTHNIEHKIGYVFAEVKP